MPTTTRYNEVQEGHVDRLSFDTAGVKSAESDPPSIEVRAHVTEHMPTTTRMSTAYHLTRPVSSKRGTTLQALKSVPMLPNTCPPLHATMKSKKDKSTAFHLTRPVSSQPESDPPSVEVRAHVTEHMPNTTRYKEVQEGHVDRLSFDTAGVKSAGKRHSKC
jgi:hypothetical protein